MSFLARRRGLLGLMSMLSTLGALRSMGCGALSVDGSDPGNAAPTPSSSGISNANVDATPLTDTGTRGSCRSTFEPSPDCKHPPVEARCRDGFCEIPPGCFVIGSPVCQPGRGARNEDEAQVTLTHRFEISQHEVTQGEWSAAGFENEARPVNLDAGIDFGNCIAPSCPASHLSWFDAVAYANHLSGVHQPPLPACYVLEACEGPRGAGMSCKSIRSTTPNVYDCLGYRLPTESEWEYTARAGTRTAYYSGPMVGDSDANKPCHERTEPNLDKVAWYCGTATSFTPFRIETHPVMGRQANAWGIYDQLGNVSEWTSDEHDGFRFRNGPHVDPGSVLGSGSQRTKRGGSSAASALFTTVSIRSGSSWDVVDAHGVRLVRTLPPR